MFDQSMSRSKIYFTVLQILRIIKDWIVENHAQIKRIRGGGATGEPIFDPKDSITEQNWVKVENMMKARVERILDRVKAKNEEIQSLRDGVR